MRDHFVLFSHYNLWANRLLYTAVGALPAEEIVRDRQGFFRSILGTLNHGLLADRLWLARMRKEDHDWFLTLDQILYTDFTELRTAREETDRAILEAIPDLPLRGELAYTNAKGESARAPWTVILGHIFNHQTHHRGQVHGMLSQAGHHPPQLDLLYFPRDSFHP